MNVKFILCIIVLCSCQHNTIITYEEGIDLCTRLVAERQNENPGILVGSSPECIVGAQLPKFESKTLSGKLIDQDYFIGKNSIINFWFEGCPPCVAEIPIFNKIVKQFGTSDFNYISIGRDDETDIVAFLETHPWQFEHIPNGREIIENNFKTMWGYPITFVTDRKAKIIAVFRGLNEDKMNELTSVMETLMN